MNNLLRLLIITVFISFTAGCVGGNNHPLTFGYGDRPLISSETNDDFLAIDSLTAWLLAERAALDEKPPAQVVESLNVVLKQYPRAAPVYRALAEQEIRRRNWDAALQAAVRAVELNSNDLKAQLLHARLLIIHNRPQQAILKLSNLINQFPHSQAPYIALTTIYMQKEQYRAAVRTMQRLLYNNPESLTARYYLGVIYGSKLKRFSQAVSMFRQIIAMQPENINARKALAQLYLDNNKPRKALDELLALEQHAPSDRAIQLRIVILYYELGESATAIDRLKHLLVVDPDAHKLRYYLGVMLEKKGDFAQAQQVYDKLPIDSGFFIDSRLRIANHYYQLHQLPQAIAVLQQALAKRKKSPELYKYLISLLDEQGDIAQAVKVMGQAVRNLPQHAEYYYKLGIYYDQLKKPTRALKIMRKVLTLDPHNIGALNYLGYTYAEKGVRLEEAEDMLQQALLLKPQDGHILDSLGWLYFRKGEHEKALDMLQRASQIITDEPVVMFHLAKALLATGKKVESIAILQRAAQILKEQGRQDAGDQKLTEKLQEALSMAKAMTVGNNQDETHP